MATRRSRLIVNWGGCSTASRLCRTHWRPRQRRGEETTFNQEEWPMRTLAFGNRVIGDGQPTYIVAEIGINHNGSLDIARRLIDAAANAKCDAVKFQKRTPELCVPVHQRDQVRHTPWGTMTYLEYRRRMEFDV